MLWEKKDLKKPDKRGYLYIRESIYERDKRSLTRKPRKLGTGKGHENRGKYTKKKDIYCGKIVEIAPKDLILFQTYIENQKLDYTELKINSRFEELIDLFVNYLLDIHDIGKDEFYNGNKVAYTIANGFLSRETIEFVKRFNAKGEDFAHTHFEISRFANRCEDSGIYDEDIILSLYMKIIPTKDYKDIKEELHEIRDKKLIEKKFNSFRDYMREEHE